MRMGEVGFPQREIEVIPATEPVRQPVPEQVPAAPAVPAPAQPVPAEPALVP